MANFTHIDEKGNALMVDVGHKQVTSRMALATGRIFMNDECYKAVKSGQVTKGDVLGPYCGNYGGKEDKFLDTSLSQFIDYQVHGRFRIS